MMYFLIFMMVVGVGILGGVFCMTLIGAAPWSHKKTRAPFQLFGKTLSTQEIAIATNHIVLGILWVSLWAYSLAMKWDPFTAEFAPSSFELALQIATAVILLGSGIAVVTQTTHWRRIYTIGVTAVVFCASYAMVVAKPFSPGAFTFVYILGGITFVLVCAFTAMLYITDRRPRKEPRSEMLWPTS